jgi:hypothetical protein
MSIIIIKHGVSSLLGTVMKIPSIPSPGKSFTAGPSERPKYATSTKTNQRYFREGKGTTDSSKSIVIFGLFGGFKPIGFMIHGLKPQVYFFKALETPIIPNDSDMTYAYKSASYRLICMI